MLVGRADHSGHEKGWSQITQRFTPRGDFPSGDGLYHGVEVRKELPPSKPGTRPVSNVSKEVRKDLSPVEGNDRSLKFVNAKEEP